LQSANVSKAVRYEATNAICLKKIEVLEKQAFLLDKEITAVNQDISDLRLKKRATDDSKSVVSKFSQVSKRSKLGGEANGSRLDALRKKVDKESERNKQMQADVDKVRREINTTKRLNEQLVIDLKSITEKLDCEARNALKLDEEIASKR
jgi:prefoldin subunit 5